MPQEATGKTGVPSETRQKPERPRDELGRPLPWGADASAPAGLQRAMSTEENNSGRKFLVDWNFFGAHEAWETAWKQSKGTGDEELFKGLSQLGAGYVHLLRGNAHGATTLLRRAASRVGRYPTGTLGIQTAVLAARLEDDARGVEAGEIVPAADAASGRCPCSLVRPQPGRLGLRGRRPPHGHAVHRSNGGAARAPSPCCWFLGCSARRPRAGPWPPDRDRAGRHGDRCRLRERRARLRGRQARRRQGGRRRPVAPGG